MRRFGLVLLLLSVTLCGCSIEGKEYFGEDTTSTIKQPYSNNEEYILEAFDNKDVTVREVDVYNEFDTSGPQNSGIFTEVQVVSQTDNNTETGSTNTSSKSSSVKFIWPVTGSAKITSRFGGRTSPGGIGSTNHHGIDIACNIGSSVVASASGTVTVAQWQSATNHKLGYGLWIEIDHGNGLRTRYGHLSKLKVAVGDKVTQGMVIALSGNSGASTGPHCHFEVRKNNIAENPTKYVSANK